MADFGLDDHIANLVTEFYSNLEDDLDFLEQEILNLNDNNHKGSIRNAYAKVHNIKGSSGALGKRVFVWLLDSAGASFFAKP